MSKINLIEILKKDLSMVYTTSGKETASLAFLKSLIFDPGFQLITFVRIYQYLIDKSIFGKIISLSIWRISMLIFSCDISPHSTIGPGLRIPHPIGVVIGNGVEIGKANILYQNVTLGAKSPKSSSGYPKIEDNCIIGAGSVIVGHVIVKKGTLVKANSLKYQ